MKGRPAQGKIWVPPGRSFPAFLIILIGFGLVFPGHGPKAGMRPGPRLQGPALIGDLRKLIEIPAMLDLSDLGRRVSGALALTPDKSRLVVARDIQSTNDAYYGVSVVELATGSVASVVLPEEGRPFRIAVDPTGQRAFVAVSGASGSTETEGRNRVDILTLGEVPAFQKSIVLENSPSPFGPVDIVLNSAGTLGYVSDRGNFQVHFLAVYPGAVEPHLGVESPLGAPTGLAVTPDDGRLYVANRSPSTVACMSATSFDLGGGDCAGLGTITTSIGPSGVGCDIEISPDGHWAYVSCAAADPCISVIDVDPTSVDFNREVAMIPTTTDRVEAIDLSEDGHHLFAVSRFRKEVLVIDTEARKQVQRITMSEDSDPFDVLVRSSPPVVGDAAEGVVAWVSDLLGRRVLEIAPGQGNFVSPDGDERKSDGYVDTRSEAEGCPDPYTPGRPDVGVDEVFVSRVSENEPNCRLFDVFGSTYEVCFAPLNPLEFVVYPPPPMEGQGLVGRVLERVRRAFQLEAPDKLLVSVDGQDEYRRVDSLLVEGYRDGQLVQTSSVRAVDDDQDRIMDELVVDGPLFFPDFSWSPGVFDLDGDGGDDYVAWPLNQNQQQLFLPLGDSNSDGSPDSTVWDFDHDGRPDPDLPLFPLVSGPPSPAAVLELHFAHFGDGEQGGDNVFSRIVLQNLDRDNQAAATIELRDDAGQPLTVDLNGSQVQGQIDVVIPAGGVSVYQTDGKGVLVTGSVCVRADRALSGVILFGGNVGVAGVGASPEFSHGFLAPVQGDVAARINTGVAIQNLEQIPQGISLTLSDLEGHPLATADLGIAAGGHRALFLPEIDWVPDVELSELHGLLRAAGHGRMTATVLQTRELELATLPVAPNYFNDEAQVSANRKGKSAPSAQTQTRDRDQHLHFAQFGNGQSAGSRISSQIILLNLTGASASCRILLRGDSGEALTVRLNGENVTGELELDIPAGGARVLESDGQGDLAVGSVVVESDRALSGVILFAGNTGVAGVGRSIPLVKGFTAPVESRRPQTAAGVQTGVAVMNLLPEPEELQLSLLDESGALLGTGSIDLPPLGHRALFVDQIDWQPAGPDALSFEDFTGQIRVRNGGRTAATVLETRQGIFATRPVEPIFE